MTDQKLVTTKKLAARYNVHCKTIRMWASAGILPVVQLSSRCIRFNLAHCTAILDGSKHIVNPGTPRRVRGRTKRFSANVRPYKWEGRANLKWVVHINHPLKGRRRRFFPTKQQAESEASAQRIEFENYGLKGMDLSSSERLEAIAAIEALRPFNATITDAMLEFVERRQESLATFAEMAALYLDSRRNLGRSNRYLDTVKSVFSRLSETFGPRRMSDITATDIQAWIEAREVGPQTRNHFRAMLHAIFAFSEKRKIIRENIVRDVERHKVPVSKVGILTPDQMRSLLAAAKKEPDVLATVALGGFGGLRPEEIARLKWSAIDLEHGQIDCGAEITKTASHRYVKIEPVLAAWLKVVTGIPVTEQVQGDNFRRRYEEVRKRAGFALRGFEDDLTEEQRQALIPWPHDGLRHSFASYHLAQFKNAAETAIQLGHEGTTMLYQNYRSRVPETAAGIWWALLPATGAIE